MLKDQTMKANVFRSLSEFGIEDVPRPTAGFGEAVIRTKLSQPFVQEERNGCVG